MKNILFTVTVICGIVIMLIVSAMYFKGSSTMAIGIAHSKDYKITTEKPAAVNKIFVKPGQQVKANEKLIELSSPALEAQISKLQYRIKALKNEIDEEQRLADNRIAFTKAQELLSIAELQSQMDQIEKEIKVDRQLYRHFIDENDSLLDWNNLAKLNALQRQQQLQRDKTEITFKTIQDEKRLRAASSSHQLLALEQELNILLDERKTLTKCASQQGVIENVLVKEGEQIEAYAPLLSVSPVSPQEVIAYLSNKKIPPGIGTTVSVKPYGSQSVEIYGKVIGFGAVVPLPDILQVSTAVKSFGREMFVEIGEGSALASGQKVLVK